MYLWQLPPYIEKKNYFKTCIKLKKKKLYEMKYSFTHTTAIYT